MNTVALITAIEKYFIERDGEVQLILPAENDAISQDVTALIQRFIPGQALVINDVKSSLSGPHLVIIGQTDLFNLRGLEVEAIFYLPPESTGGDIQLTLTFQLPHEGWTFSQSFPSLGETILDALQLSNPQFILASAGNSDVTQDRPLQRGMNFRGVLNYDASFLQQVRWLFQETTPLVLSGTIAHVMIPGGAPEIVLTTATYPSAISLGSGALSVWLKVYSTVDRVSEASRDIPLLREGIDFCANLQIGDSDRPLNILLKMPLSNNTYESLSLAAGVDDLAEIALTGLSELDSLFSGSGQGRLAIGDLLPAEFRPSNHLSLSHFIITISPPRRRVIELKIVLQLQQLSLEIIPPIANGHPPLCKLERIGFDFTLRDPLSPSLDNVTAKITASLRFAGDFSLVSSMVLPSKEIRAYLDGGNAISLRPVLTQLYGRIPLPDNFPTVYKLDLLLNPVTRAFYMSAAIIEHWAVNIGFTQLELRSLAFDLSYDGTFRGTIGGTGRIADADASAQAEFGDGFVLRSTISRLNLATMTQTLLGGIALPDELPDVAFSNIELSIAPATGAFTISGQAVIEWDLGASREGLTTRVDVNIHRTVGSGVGPRPGSSRIDCTLSLHGQGPLELADDFTLDNVALDFSLTPERTWSVSGSVNATLFDKAFVLAAGYRQSNGASMLTLDTAASSPTELINVPGIGSLSLSGLTLEIARQTRLSQTPGSASAPATTTAWNLSARGGLRIDQVLGARHATALSARRWLRRLALRPGCRRRAAAVADPRSAGLSEAGFRRHLHREGQPYHTDRRPALGVDV